MTTEKIGAGTAGGLLHQLAADPGAGRQVRPLRQGAGLGHRPLRAQRLLARGLPDDASLSFCLFYGGIKYQCNYVAYIFLCYFAFFHNFVS